MVVLIVGWFDEGGFMIEGCLKSNGCWCFDGYEFFVEKSVQCGVSIMMI